jgi:hypothetical protein
VARAGQIHFNYDAQMKRQEYNFPSPRRERSTQLDLSDDDLMLAPFLDIDQSSVPVSIFYKRSLPKKVKLDEKSQERQPLVIEHEPVVYEEEPIILPEIINEEVEEPKPVTQLVVKRRNLKVREIGPVSQLVEKREEPLEIFPLYDRVSVVMAFRGSGDGRLEGLKKCIQCLREQAINCYIILVEQDYSPVNQDELEPLVDSYLFTYSSDMFNKSWAFNCGAIIAPDDLILLHDCDLLVPKNYIKESIKVLGIKDMALPWAKILYLTEGSSKNYPDGQPKVSSVLTSHQAVGGSLLVRKKFYLKIGGMDERFVGWGGEDNAFYAKAAKLGRINRVSPAVGLTLLHHYHKPAQKWHPHSQINNNILWEYSQRSDKDIMVRVRTLDPIGDPLKHKNQEESQREEIKMNHVSSL